MPWKLNALANLLYGNSTAVEEPCADCELRCASASVTPHEYHVLVRLSRESDDSDSMDKTWWPETLGDRLTAFETILEDKKRIKATAFEYPDDRPFQHEAYVFNRTKPVVNNHVVAPDVNALVEQVKCVILGDDEATEGNASPNKGMTFIVCAHRARDARCGSRGPAIATAIAASGSTTVLLSSHVGGHVYAGNVIVYSGGSASGTWFGGVHESSVPKLLEGLRDAEERGINPARCQSLRPYWRGTSGRSKEEQASFFAACAGVNGNGDIEDILKT